MSNEDPDLELIFAELIESDEFEQAELLLMSHPEWHADVGLARSLMFTSVNLRKLPAIAMLVSYGVSVNIIRSSSNQDRPIGAAAALNYTEIVQWLVDNHSDINYEWDGHAPTCQPLVSAIINNNIDIVKILVEAGALLNAIDRAGRTPLSWAIEYDRIAIVGYLKSRGAIE